MSLFSTNNLKRVSSEVVNSKVVEKKSIVIYVPCGLECHTENNNYMKANMQKYIYSLITDYIVYLSQV